jgi:hypothetical protein
MAVPPASHRAAELNARKVLAEKIAEIASGQLGAFEVTAILQLANANAALQGAPAAQQQA